MKRPFRGCANPWGDLLFHQKCTCGGRVPVPAGRIVFRYRPAREDSPNRR